MAQCSQCGAETEVHFAGNATCEKCMDKGTGDKSSNVDQIRRALVDRIAQATAGVSEANRKFNDAIDQFPSGLSNPNGVQRIKNASNGLTVARKEMMTAHRRLNEFIKRGIVPEDLKRSGD
jgi:hypothetical protein